MELQSKGSVLLVEDHQDIAELVYDYMEDVGYELDYAPDGEVGINLVAQNEKANQIFHELHASGAVEVDEHGNVSPSKPKPQAEFHDFDQQ